MLADPCNLCCISRYVQAYEPGGCSPPCPRIGQNHFFEQTLKFSRRSQQPKMKKCFFLYLLTAKNRIHFVQRDEVPEVWGFVLIIIGWAESGKAILQVK